MIPPIMAVKRSPIALRKKKIEDRGLFGNTYWIGRGISAQVEDE